MLILLSKIANPKVFSLKLFIFKVNEVEQRERDSSTIYTSVSIRANQQVETLQNQLQLVTVQRDELQKKISEAEDKNNKQFAALTNLQCVLEQFQRGIYIYSIKYLY